MVELRKSSTFGLSRMRSGPSVIWPTIILLSLFLSSYVMSSSSHTILEDGPSHITLVIPKERSQVVDLTITSINTPINDIYVSAVINILPPCYDSVSNGIIEFAINANPTQTTGISGETIYTYVSPTVSWDSVISPRTLCAVSSLSISVYSSKPPMIPADTYLLREDYQDTEHAIIPPMPFFSSLEWSVLGSSLGPAHQGNDVIIYAPLVGQDQLSFPIVLFSNIWFPQQTYISEPASIVLTLHDPDTIPDTDDDIVYCNPQIPRKSAIPRDASAPKYAITKHVIAWSDLVNSCLKDNNWAISEHRFLKISARLELPEDHPYQAWNDRFLATNTLTLIRSFPPYSLSYHIQNLDLGINSTKAPLTIPLVGNTFDIIVTSYTPFRMWCVPSYRISEPDMNQASGWSSSSNQGSSYFPIENPLLRGELFQGTLPLSNSERFRMIDMLRDTTKFNHISLNAYQCYGTIHPDGFDKAYAFTLPFFITEVNPIITIPQTNSISHIKMELLLDSNRLSITVVTLGTTSGTLNITINGWYRTDQSQYTGMFEYYTSMDITASSDGSAMIRSHYVNMSDIISAIFQDQYPVADFYQMIATAQMANDIGQPNRELPRKSPVPVAFCRSRMTGSLCLQPVDCVPQDNPDTCSSNGFISINGDGLCHYECTCLIPWEDNHQTGCIETRDCQAAIANHPECPFGQDIYTLIDDSGICTVHCGCRNERTCSGHGVGHLVEYDSENEQICNIFPCGICTSPLTPTVTSLDPICECDPKWGHLDDCSLHDACITTFNELEQCSSHGTVKLINTDTNQCDTQCTCDDGWGGEYCQVPIRCLDQYEILNSCNNNGTIVYDSQTGLCDTKCSCYDSEIWTGTTCNQKPQCSTKCAPFGFIQSSTDINTGAVKCADTCTCLNQFKGALCSDCPIKCFKGQLNTSSLCYDNIKTSIPPCLCSTNYLGRYCQYYEVHSMITIRNRSLPDWLVSAVKTRTTNTNMAQFTSLLTTHINTMLGYDNDNDNIHTNTVDISYPTIYNTDIHDLTIIPLSAMNISYVECQSTIGHDIVRVSIPSTLSFRVTTRVGTSIATINSEATALHGKWAQVLQNGGVAATISTALVDAGISIIGQDVASSACKPFGDDDIDVDQSDIDDLQEDSTDDHEEEQTSNKATLYTCINISIVLLSLLSLVFLNNIA